MFASAFIQLIFIYPSLICSTSLITKRLVDHFLLLSKRAQNMANNNFPFLTFSSRRNNFNTFFSVLLEGYHANANREKKMFNPLGLWIKLEEGEKEDEKSFQHFYEIFHLFRFLFFRVEDSSDGESFLKGKNLFRPPTQSHSRASQRQCYLKMWFASDPLGCFLHSLLFILPLHVFRP